MLNIVTTGGDFDPYVKYNAKAGRWYVKKDEGEVEVTNPTFVADFENIKTGWFFFKAGAAPQKVFDESLEKPSAKPQQTYVDEKGVTRDCFKRGFETKLYSEQSFGGVVVLSGASMHLNNAIAELYAQYKQEAKNNAGKLPVVQASGTVAMKDKQGTNYKPLFQIVKWVDRPAALAGDKTTAATAPEAVAAPAAQAATAVSEF